MKVSSISFCLLALAICHLSGLSEARDVCSIFSNNTVIRDPESCSRYITCINFVSVYKTCTGSTPFFDKDTGKCVKALAQAVADGCDVSCKGEKEKFITDPKSCFGYYYCMDEAAPYYGVCPEGLHFNYTTQGCIWKHQSACRAATLDYCSIIKNGVKFNNEHGCDRYYVCTKGVLKDEKCSGKYYEPQTGLCVAKTLVDCNAHPYPKDVCGTVKKPKQNVMVADGATCNGYFKCVTQSDGKPDPAPRWYKCNSDLFFDAKTQTCKNPTTVPCSEDRCEGRTVPFVLSGTQGCRHYLRCDVANDRTMDEKSCGNYFFDEAKGVCVPHVLTYPVC